MLTQQWQRRVQCGSFNCFVRQPRQENSHHQLKSTTFIMQLHKSYLGHLQRSLIINNKWPGLVSEEAVLMLITVVVAWKLIYKTLILLDALMCSSTWTQTAFSCIYLPMCEVVLFLLLLFFPPHRLSPLGDVLPHERRHKLLRREWKLIQIK